MRSAQKMIPLMKKDYDKKVIEVQQKKIKPLQLRQRRRDILIAQNNADDYRKHLDEHMRVLRQCTYDFNAREKVNKF